MLTLVQLINGSYDIKHCGDVVANVNPNTPSFTVVEKEWNLLPPEQQEKVKALAIKVLRGKHEDI